MFEFLISVVLSFSFFGSPETQREGSPECDRKAARAEAIRKDTRARVAKTCAAMKADPVVCKMIDAMVIRESSGNTCAVHTLGEGEYGLGPLGLSVRWHLPKWNRHEDESILHVPEVSTIVTLRIFRRAVTRHDAQDLVDLNAVFATGRLRYRDGKDASFCYRLRRHGVKCGHRIDLDSLGVDLDRKQQVAFVERLIGEPLTPAVAFRSVAASEPSNDASDEPNDEPSKATDGDGLPDVGGSAP